VASWCLVESRLVIPTAVVCLSLQLTTNARFYICTKQTWLLQYNACSCSSSLSHIFSVCRMCSAHIGPCDHVVSALLYFHCLTVHCQILTYSSLLHNSFSTQSLDSTKQRVQNVLNNDKHFASSHLQPQSVHVMSVQPLGVITAVMSCRFNH